MKEGPTTCDSCAINAVSFRISTLTLLMYGPAIHVANVVGSYDPTLTLAMCHSRIDTTWVSHDQ